MMAVVEGRRLRSWNCKQVGHLAKACSQKAADLLQPPGEGDITNTTDTTNVTSEEETSIECT